MKETGLENGILNKILLIAYDIAAINIAAYLALIARFYVASRFLGGYDRYLSLYIKYAWVYTIICIVVFSLFNLYKINTRYAGFNDFNNIFYANIILLLIHFIGTIVLGMRMPLSFYIIEACFQFIMVAAVRFAQRIYITEVEYLTRNNKSKPNVLIVGANETGKMVIKHIDHEKNMQPVCVVNVKKKNMGGLFDGLPIINGLDSVENIIDKYKVDCVVIAADLKAEYREIINNKCLEKKVIVQDYVSLSSYKNKGIEFRDIAPYIIGNFELNINGKTMEFDSVDLAIEYATDNYSITSISANRDILSLEIEHLDSNVKAHPETEWVKKQEEETGQAISFF